MFLLFLILILLVKIVTIVTMIKLYREDGDYSFDIMVISGIIIIGWIFVGNIGNENIKYFLTLLFGILLIVEIVSKEDQHRTFSLGKSRKSLDLVSIFLTVLSCIVILL